MSGNSRLGPGEELVAVTVGLVMAAAAIGWVFTATTWHGVQYWLVTQRVLVAAHDGSLVRLPGGSGAGLDAPRLGIAAAVVMFLLTCVVSALRRRAALEAGEQPS